MNAVLATLPTRLSRFRAVGELRLLDRYRILGLAGSLALAIGGVAAGALPRHDPFAAVPGRPAGCAPASRSRSASATPGWRCSSSPGCSSAGGSAPRTARAGARWWSRWRVWSAPLAWPRRCSAGTSTATARSGLDGARRRQPVLLGSGRAAGQPLPGRRAGHLVAHADPVRAGLPAAGPLGGRPVSATRRCRPCSACG